MYELFIKKLVTRYKIYIQMDDFLDWKKRFAFEGDRRKKLLNMVHYINKHDLKDIGIGDLEDYKRHLYSVCGTKTEISWHLREIRCFLRFHKKRGVQCLRPEVVGEFDINYNCVR